MCKMKEIYICQKCGNLMYESELIEEEVSLGQSEFWGAGVTEYATIQKCPHCYGERFEIEYVREQERE